ncbi:hypothetical protein [Flavobacterium mesophilum]|uniref:hypothetical protein n=1 Tax=Flavobacterium mesophilum TaxID=3143495 RepID=UPI0031D70BD5
MLAEEWKDGFFLLFLMTDFFFLDFQKACHIHWPKLKKNMMYRINTLLADFACMPDSGKMLANITWHRFDAASGRICGFTEAELELFQAFMLANASNFPNPHYPEALSDDFALGPSVGDAKSEVPHYLILSKEPHHALRDKPLWRRAGLYSRDTGKSVAYDLEFDAAGKIEAYRRV